MSVSIKAEATLPISEGCLQKMINGSSSSVSPTGGGGNLTPPSPLEATVKAETSRIMSPNLTKNNTSSSQAASHPNSDGSETSSSGQKRIQNNNTSSYTSGGRLKFYKGKRIFNTSKSSCTHCAFSASTIFSSHPRKTTLKLCDTQQQMVFR